MTPREKADAIVAELRRQGSGWSGDLSLAIEHAIVAAIIGEREACAKIGDDRLEEIERTYPAKPGPSREWHEKAERLTEVNHYRSMIRARAKEGEKKNG